MANSQTQYGDVEIMSDLVCESCGLESPPQEFVWGRVGYGDKAWLLAQSASGWTCGDVVAEVALCPAHVTGAIIAMPSEAVDSCAMCRMPNATHDDAVCQAEVEA